MAKAKNNSKIFKIIAIIVTLGILFVLLAVLLSSKKTNNETVDTKNNETTQVQDQNNEANDSKQETKQPEPQADPNDGYFVVKEWGLRFKAPEGLTDIRYVINGETLAFYAKPIGSDIQYAADYNKFDGDSPAHAIGVVYRSSEPTKPKMDGTVDGKKIGDYYYYTSWAFSGLATGAACSGMYEGGYDEKSCQSESAIFNLVNQGENALINTIQLSQ